MPNCFQLVSKRTGEPTAFNKIDDEICEHLGRIPHERDYIYGWYDIIGLYIACGKELGSPELRDALVSEELKSVLTFLEENYTSNAWAEIGKRY